MKVEFKKIDYEDIFDKDYKNINKNNLLEFNTDTVIIYAPNGTGKTSFGNILDRRKEIEVEYEVNGKKNLDCFYVIKNLENRSSISKENETLFLGKDIKRERELKFYIGIKEKEIEELVISNNPFIRIRMRENISFNNLSYPGEFSSLDMFSKEKSADECLNEILIETDEEFFMQLKNFNSNKNYQEFLRYFSFQEKKENFDKEKLYFNEEYIKILKSIEKIKAQLNSVIKMHSGLFFNQQFYYPKESVKCLLCKINSINLKKNENQELLYEKIIDLLNKIYSKLEKNDYLEIRKDFDFIIEEKKIEKINLIQEKIISDVKDKFLKYKELLIDKLKNIEIKEYEEYKKMVEKK
ncbi:MAG: hypothetical protein MJH09_07340 [Cetobacterium sp.]|nr:hypothetical protein [Cetobacterium sp.]